jgi:nucleotide-binding universal stress UspA family protein
VNKENPMPGPILAAYDPFKEDRAPVDLALAAAELTGAPVVAVAVTPTALETGWADPTPIYQEVEEIVSSALARLRADPAVETTSTSGRSVPQALLELAAERDARLLVVGSTGRAATGRVLPGSTAERLLAGSPCPVALAAHGYRREPVRTVAVGFADTPEGHAALTAAHALAHRAGAKLRVIAAVHASGAADAAFAEGTPPLRGVTLEGHHRAEHETAMAQAVTALPAGVEIEQELHVDDPADVLVRVSQHVDVLVCGSRGYGPLRSLLLGGVSRRVVDTAHCPVLVLPRGVELELEEILGPVVADAATA